MASRIRLSIKQEDNQKKVREISQVAALNDIPEISDEEQEVQEYANVDDDILLAIFLLVIMIVPINTSMNLNVHQY